MKWNKRLIGIAGCFFIFGLVQSAWSSGDKNVRYVQIYLGPLTTPQTSPARLLKEHPKKHVVSIKKQTHGKGAPPKRRSRELSWQELVVVALDDGGQEIDRVIVPDPRLIRYESTDSSGNFVESEIFYREEADFIAVFSEDSMLRAIKVFQPRWTGSEYLLDLLGETTLP